jgi:hypothetical protein
MATSTRPVTPSTGWLLRARFPGAALSIAAAGVSVAEDLPLVTLPAGVTAAVFVAAIVTRADWSTSRALRHREDGVRR